MDVLSKEQMIAKIERDLACYDMQVEHLDPKPWGIEVRIARRSRFVFISLMFGYTELPEDIENAAFDSKFLLIEEGKRLRGDAYDKKDAWLRVKAGTVCVTDPDTSAVTRHRAGTEAIHVRPGTSPRLSSLSGWAVVAEISYDPDATPPSN